MNHTQWGRRLDGVLLVLLILTEAFTPKGYDVSVNRVISREAESEGQARIRFSLNTKIKEN
jgi:hypothetical protein